MKRLAVIVALAAAVSTSCFRGTIEGSGTVVTEERDAAGFDRIALSNIGQVELVKGEVEGVSVRADDNILPHLTTEVSAGILKIGMTPRATTKIFRPTEPIAFVVTYRELSGISVSGSGSVEANRLEAPFLELDVSGSGGVVIHDLVGEQVRTSISGSGMVSIRGLGRAQTVTISGSGGYYGQEFVTDDARVNLSGSGMTSVNAQKTLSVMISGSGTVTYSGDPDITQSISGAGVLRPAD